VQALGVLLEYLGRVPKFLTPFITQICDFRHLIYDPGQKFDTLFMSLAAGTVQRNISYDSGFLLTVLLIMMKKKLLLRNLFNLRLER